MASRITNHSTPAPEPGSSPHCPGEANLSKLSRVTVFDESVVAAVTGHMNGDHTADNLLIARAFGSPDASESVMTGVTSEAGIWRIVDAAGSRDLEVPWPSGPISERPQIRREVVLLYQEACAKLGIDPREEHGAAAAAAEPAAADSDAPAASERPPFSKVIREGSWGDHSDSEGATFMEDIMRGRGTREDYVALVEQHYFMYEALEAATARHAGDPRFSAFHQAELERMATLERDLEFLIGPDWRDRIEAVPATQEYAERIREVDAEGWIAGVIAHHYTRYLGDLSGGQMIARRVSKQHGLEQAGVEFYDFAALGDLSAFKDRYRSELDRLGESLSDEERSRVLDEVRASYHFNTRVFIDLARAKAQAEANAQV